MVLTHQTCRQTKKHHELLGLRSPKRLDPESVQSLLVVPATGVGSAGGRPCRSRVPWLGNPCQQVPRYMDTRGTWLPALADGSSTQGDHRCHHAQLHHSAARPFASSAEVWRVHRTQPRGLGPTSAAANPLEPTEARRRDLFKACGAPGKPIRDQMLQCQPLAVSQPIRRVCSGGNTHSPSPKRHRSTRRRFEAARHQSAVSTDLPLGLVALVIARPSLDRTRALTRSFIRAACLVVSCFSLGLVSGKLNRRQPPNLVPAWS
jgi:hypothetical protein